LRRGLYLDRSMIPSVEISENSVNAYLLDFYKHGQVEALRRYNKIRNDELFLNLKQFSLILKTIRTALVNRAASGAEDITNMFELVSNKFHQNFKNAFPNVRV
jgi:hypothetical protein